MAASLQVSGLREIQRAVRDADPAVKRAVRDTLKEAAAIVAEEGRRRAPVRSGRLAGSIRPGATSTVGYVQAGTGARVPYAGVIEFGWRRHNIAPHPYLFPAADAKADAVSDAFDRGISETLSNLFGGD